jgi:type III secretion system FlhB-like substrate exporter
MKKREETKDVDIAGRKFRIRKFEAFTGSYIAYKIIGQIAPSAINNGSDNISKAITSMNKEDFISIQKDCLKMVQEIKQAGNNEIPMQIILENGKWGVEGLENDAITVMALTIQVLVFNVSSFFDADRLKELTSSLSGLTFADAKI